MPQSTSMRHDEADRIVSAVMTKLRHEREQQDLSLRQLEPIAGISRTGIGMMEKGERSPSLHACLRLADALGLNLADVLSGVTRERRR